MDHLKDYMEEKNLTNHNEKRKAQDGVSYDLTDFDDHTDLNDRQNSYEDYRDF